MYNENQLSSLRYRCLLFFLFQLRFFFIISHSCQKSILSFHEVRFPLTTIRVAEVRCPVSDVLLKKYWAKKVSTKRGEKWFQNLWNLWKYFVLSYFLCFYCWQDNFGRKRRENLCENSSNMVTEERIIELELASQNVASWMACIFRLQAVIMLISGCKQYW